MKSLIRGGLVLTLLLNPLGGSLTDPRPLMAQLQPSNTLIPGLYNRASYYIQIAQKGDRLCYQGMSRNGITVASISPIKSGYKIAGDGRESTVRQINAQTIEFGIGSQDYYILQSATSSVGGTLEACLNSRGRFSKQEQFGR